MIKPQPEHFIYKIDYNRMLLNFHDFSVLYYHKSTIIIHATIDQKLEEKLSL